MTVTLENAVAEELITFKLNSIKTTINNILEAWKEDTTDEFIAKVKSGEIPNRELDAITLRQLEADMDRLQSLLASIKRAGS